MIITGEKHMNTTHVQVQGKIIERIKEAIKELTATPTTTKYIAMCFEKVGEDYELDVVNNIAKAFAIHGRIEFMNPFSSIAHVDSVKLDVERIKALYRLNKGYCVVYETDNIVFYAPFAMQIPHDAEFVRELKAKDFQYWECEYEDGEKRKHLNYDDFEEDYCIGKYKEHNLVFSNISDNVLTVPSFTMLSARNGKQFLEELVKRVGIKLLEPVSVGYRTEAGGRGYVVFDGKSWRMHLDELRSPGVISVTLSIGESSTGRCTSSWDDYEITCEKQPGRYIELRIGDDVFNARIDIDNEVFEELIEDQRKRDEEERQRKLEEIRKWREESEKKQKEIEEEVSKLIANKDSLISALLQKAADWADGIGIYHKIMHTEDEERKVYYVVNVKRNRQIYTKTTWRLIHKVFSSTRSLEDAYVIAAMKLCNNANAVVITKDKNVKCVNIEEKGDYIYFV